RLGPGPRRGRGRGAPGAHRHAQHQRRPAGVRLAVRRLQAVRRRPRDGTRGVPRLPRDQVHRSGCLMVSREGLEALLSPRSFALIGASDKSTFSLLVHGNLEAAGHRDRTYLVNPRSPEVHGRATHPSCVAIGQPVDLAFVMVPAARAGDAIRDAAAAGVRAVMVLSSGYAETGPEGRARQDELVALAEELGITMLGPNVLGLTNVTAGIPAMALSDPPTQPGGVALISQSGASCGAMKD